MLTTRSSRCAAILLTLVVGTDAHGGQPVGGPDLFGEASRSNLHAFEDFTSEYVRVLDRDKAKKPYHPIGLLEEIGVKAYQPTTKSGERS